MSCRPEPVAVASWAVHTLRAPVCLRRYACESSAIGATPAPTGLPLNQYGNSANRRPLHSGTTRSRSYPRCPTPQPRAAPLSQCRTFSGSQIVRPCWAVGAVIWGPPSRASSERFKSASLRDRFYLGHSPRESDNQLLQYRPFRSKAVVALESRCGETFGEALPEPLRGLIVHRQDHVRSHSLSLVRVAHCKSAGGYPMDLKYRQSAGDTEIALIGSGQLLTSQYRLSGRS